MLISQQKAQSTYNKSVWDIGNKVVAFFLLVYAFTTKSSRGENSQNNTNLLRYRIAFVT